MYNSDFEKTNEFPYDINDSLIIVIIQPKCLLFVRIVMDDSQAVAKLQGEDILTQGRAEHQDKSPYFSLSSHHRLRRNTN